MIASVAPVQPWYAPRTARTSSLPVAVAREPQRQLVGLGAGVDQEDGVERRREARGERLRELDHCGVQEPGVGVEPPKLPRDRGLDGGVAVAEHGDVVDDVDVGAAARVHEMVAPAPLDAGRGIEVVDLHPGEDAVPALEQAGGVVRRRGGQARRETKQGRRVRAEAEPGVRERRHGAPRRLEPGDGDRWTCTRAGRPSGPSPATLPTGARFGPPLPSRPPERHRRAVPRRYRRRWPGPPPSAGRRRGPGRPPVCRTAGTGPRRGGRWPPRSWRRARRPSAGPRPSARSGSHRRAGSRRPGRRSPTGLRSPRPTGPRTPSRGPAPASTAPVHPPGKPR